MLRVLNLPGWLNSGPAHWQSLWEAEHGYTRADQHDWQRPLRGDWIARLEDVVLLNSELLAHTPQGLQADLPLKNAANTAPGIVLVAHSLGCHLVAAWAAASRNAHLVKAALLVAPPDANQENLPSDLANWRRPVLEKLPFPSICAISSNDPFCSLGAGRALAAAWQSECVELGPVGHVNSESNLGDWPAGHQLLAKLLLKNF